MSAKDSTQQREASRVSARIRTTKKLLRELTTCAPLLPEQRDAVIAAAARIPTVGPR